MASVCNEKHSATQVEYNGWYWLVPQFRSLPPTAEWLAKERYLYPLSCHVSLSVGLNPRSKSTSF